MFLIQVLPRHHHLRYNDRPQEGHVDSGHPQEDDAETEEDGALDQRRDGNCAKTLRESVRDVWHLSLVLVHVRAEYHPGQSFQQQCSLLLLQLFAGDESGSYFILVFNK